MFEPHSEPNVMALPVGCDFSTEFIAGLRQRMAGKQPQDWAKITIFVNTRRSARQLSDLLSDTAGILPKIKVIGDLGKSQEHPIPPSPDRLERHLRLADLISAYLDTQSDAAPKFAIFGLADTLTTLLDEFDDEGIKIAALETINVDNQSGHWQQNLQFLNILKEYISALDGQISGAEARQRAVVNGLALKWQACPPPDPVIIAGSTGSRGTTSDFMKAVLSLPQGAIVLPGFDFMTPAKVWPRLTEEHPQFGFASLGKTLGFDPNSVKTWHKANVTTDARNALVSLALRPAPVTGDWLRDGPALRPNLTSSCKDMTLVEAPGPREEAAAIAIQLRKALFEGKKSALVTPSRSLARRVTALLQRWNIIADDSAGQPAHLSPPGMFLCMIADMLGADVTPLALLELLKHPLCAIGERKVHLATARRLELDKLRGGPAFIDLNGLGQWANDNDAADWFSTLQDALSLLKSATDQPVSQWAQLQHRVAEMLGSDEIWHQEAGRVSLDILTKITHQQHPSHYTAPQYRTLFRRMFQSGNVRVEAALAHPDVAIWGTLEARIQSADVVILAGLNDGIWPQIGRQDTWLNRDMRKQIGLQTPERRIGLSAHDFQQCIGAKEVVLSRSVRDGESPTVPSRWLMRFKNLTSGLGETGEQCLQDMADRGQTLLDLATQIDTPKEPVPPAKRPAPAPPIAARPDKLYVTRIETLIRDPYAIYARYVLRLKKLDPLTRQPDAMTKGSVLHDILETFVSNDFEKMPGDAAALFNTIVNETLDNTVPWPATRRLWRARFEKNRDWFLESEFERRTLAKPAKVEATGELVLPNGFTLSAKADRIDVDASGNVLIYDYKSGAKATVKQIKQFSVQLPLEGIIAESGGFDGIAAAKIRRLQLIFLGGDGDTVTFDETDDAMENAVQNLCALIDRYQSENTGYPARLRPELTRFEGDFDHLARRGEWHDDDAFEVEKI